MSAVATTGFDDYYIALKSVEICSYSMSDTLWGPKEGIESWEGDVEVLLRERIKGS